MNMLTWIRSGLTRVAVIAAFLAIAACSGQQKVSGDYCTLSNDRNIERLFDEAESKLADRSCHYQYEQIVGRLVAAAKESPGPENEERFAALLRSSIDRGVISKKQGRTLFSQYFDTEFYSVKAEPRNSCSALRNKDTMYASMKSELQMKREGLLEMLGDEPRFRQAQRHFADLRTVLDAVQVACSEAV